MKKFQISKERYKIIVGIMTIIVFVISVCYLIFELLNTFLSNNT